MRRLLLVVAALAASSAAARGAHAATLYAAINGVDTGICVGTIGLACGGQSNPCRSITCAIRYADPGDTIIVGPGNYSGDVDNDGNVGERGEEQPTAGCGCMLSVDRPVRLLSSHGAASTIIDATTIDVAKNVLLISDGGEFGRPGRGFTVTNTRRDLSDGLVTDGANLRIRGNQVVVTRRPDVPNGPNAAIHALFGGPVMIEGNQVLGGWSVGIRASGTGKTVRRNQVAVVGSGIEAEGDSLVSGNVVTVGNAGMELKDGARAIGNAVYGGLLSIGFFLTADETRSYSGVIQRNNIVGHTCGVSNHAVPALDATNNYWGAATGPGPRPASNVCGSGGASTITTGFATRPFAVSAPIRP
jgi:hypothetical protein